MPSQAPKNSCKTSRKKAEAALKTTSLVNSELVSIPLSLFPTKSKSSLNNKGKQHINGAQTDQEHSKSSKLKMIPSPEEQRLSCISNKIKRNS